MRTPPKRPELAQTETVDALPLACSDELAAVEFLERRRWRGCPCCVHCGSVAVYAMSDAKTGGRNRRYLWRCRDCQRQYTVRVGTVMEDSPIPLRHWVRTIWECSVSKNGVSALEISRKIQVSHKAALFMLHRLRHAMADLDPSPPRFDGEVEADEVYLGGAVRLPNGVATLPREQGTRRAMEKKVPVLAVLQRGGNVRTRVVANVRAENVQRFVMENVAKSATLYTDASSAYITLGPYHGGAVSAHHSVSHHRGEYVRKGRPQIHSNGVESFFARVRRSIDGTWHAVSREHLPRYLCHIGWLHNTRHMSDGDRVDALIARTDGRRLTYDQSKASA